MTNVRRLCSVMAIAAWALVASSSAVPAAVDSVSAEEIVARVIRAYGRVTALKEHVDGVDFRIMGTQAKVTADLYFSSVDGFYVEMQDSYAGTVSTKQFLARGGRYSSWTHARGLTQHSSESTLASAVFGASVGGFGYVEAWTLGLLLSRTTGKSAIFGLGQSLERLPDAKDLLRNFFVLRGTGPGDQITTMWIDKTTEFISRVSVADGRDRSELQFTQTPDGAGIIPETLPNTQSR